MTEPKKSRPVLTGARLVLGGVVAVACVVGAGAQAVVPWPSVAGQAAQVEVVPSAGNTVLTCVGAFRAIGRDAADALAMSVAGAMTRTPGEAVDAELSLLDAPDLSGLAEAPVTLTATPQGGAPAAVSAAESVVLAAADLAGLAAAPCRTANAESWLVGGSVETGASDIIVLSNPGDVTASVTLTAYGLEQSAANVLVPARTQVGVPLASLGVGFAQPVVRVTAAGAPVRAQLQSSQVRTLDPIGIDVQDSAGAPGPHLVFAGVRIVAAADVPTGVVRLLPTGEIGEARILVRAQADGSVVQEYDVPVEGGEVPISVNLDDLGTGDYTVEVIADGPVIGAVWTATAPAQTGDFAWMTPAPAITSEIRFAVPGGPAPRLHLVNPRSEPLTVIVAAVDGEETTVEVPGGAGAGLDLQPGAEYTLDTSGPVHAAVTMTGPDQLAGWPLWPAASAQEPITVYP